MATPKPVPPLDDVVLRRICDVLAATDGGLSNKEIDTLLRGSGISDPTPRTAGAGTVVMVSKRDRLHAALAGVQQQTRASNLVVRFIRAAMHPARYDADPALLAERRERINVALSFDALELREDNKMQRVAAAKTLSEAQRRARKLQSVLKDRGAHFRLLTACVDEIADDNFFHAVLEAAKSLAEEIRQRTGSHLDGVLLVQETLQITKNNPVPLLALSALTTSTEQSRQQGLDAGVRAIFSAARNPTAHEPKTLSTMSEQDAVDLLTQMSYLHRRLDECTYTGHLRAS